MTLTLWATMSCISRAMRVRSSRTASRARSSRSRSARTARSSTRSSFSRRRRRLSPHTHTAVKMSTPTATSPHESKFGSRESMTAKGCSSSTTARLTRAARRDPKSATE